MGESLAFDCSHMTTPLHLSNFVDKLQDLKDQACYNQACYNHAGLSLLQSCNSPVLEILSAPQPTSFVKCSNALAEWWEG